MNSWPHITCAVPHLSCLHIKANNAVQKALKSAVTTKVSGVLQSTMMTPIVILISVVVLHPMSCV